MRPRRSGAICGLCGLCGLLALGAPSSRAWGQGVGIAPHVGTLGVGADLAVAPVDRVSFRAGGNFFPFDIDITASDIDFTIDLPSPQFTALLDLFLAGSFRLSGGLLFSGDDVSLDANFTGTIDIGNTTYTAADVGTLTGVIVNDDVAPYAGIGVGKVAGGGVGFLLDLGVVFQGDPRVELAANGPIASDPSFRADLETERRDIEDDVELFRYYPVITLGFSVGL